MQRISDSLRPSLPEPEALELRSREHPLVVALAIDRVGAGTGTNAIVVHDAREHRHRGTLALRGLSLREDSLVTDLEDHAARFEGFEEDRPASGRKGAEAGFEDFLGLEKVMQDRRAHGEIDCAGTIARAGCVDADEGEALAVRARREEIAKDRKER